MFVFSPVFFCQRWLRIGISKSIPYQSHYENQTGSSLVVVVVAVVLGNVSSITRRDRFDFRHQPIFSHELIESNWELFGFRLVQGIPGSSAQNSSSISKPHHQQHREKSEENAI